MHDAAGRASKLTLHVNRLCRNARAVANRLSPGARLMAVVKANAYGHGLEETARHLALLDEVVAFGVSTIREALALQRQGTPKAILILGPTADESFPTAAAEGFALTIHEPRQVRELTRFARTAATGSLLVHLKVDTGMHRLGFAPKAVPGVLAELAMHPAVLVLGLYSHFHSADAEDLALAKAQLNRFRRLVSDLERQGLRPPLCHIANSAATVRMPASHMDMVRVGGALYGLNPSHEHCRLPEAFEPALSWTTEVVQVHKVPVGTALGYGHGWRAPRPSRIAVLPVGYADGLPRTAPGEVLVRGRIVPLVGTRSMNMSFADVTDIGNPPVRAGEPVALIGSDGENDLHCDRIATLEGTIEYEVTARIPTSDRILRALEYVGSEFHAGLP